MRAGTPNISSFSMLSRCAWNLPECHFQRAKAADKEIDTKMMIYAITVERVVRRAGWGPCKGEKSESLSAIKERPLGQAKADSAYRNWSAYKWAVAPTSCSLPRCEALVKTGKQKASPRKKPAANWCFERRLVTSRGKSNWSSHSHPATTKLFITHPRCTPASRY
jgi:hypothetical protein